ncbi:unnamed protein product [Vitrella brassicaformis CCMP3155]|uniref:Uncharacterized protein n=1 Tax=Vitrella brassicaformis (strain CCMP3155) TaxID=1169540 RepID=A0A0G4ELZ2_VITBC|nr:unnamed protein product [Vitrella brassicaformis CCMP3155]|eukprot:CEL97853.1 unnamed protein product [Vitrella brassicaformis CCMP3155]
MLIGRVKELESDVERERGMNEKLVEEVREATGESSRLAEDKSRLQAEVARREAIIDGLAAKGRRSQPANIGPHARQTMDCRAANPTPSANT